jgi:cold shock CspA family protein
VAKGRIVNIVTSKGYAFLEPDDGGKNIFFHHSQFRGDWTKIAANQHVTFDVGERRGQEQAVNVIPVGAPSDIPALVKPSRTLESYSGPRLNLSAEARRRALKDISQWKLEAKFDDLNRYFLSVPALDRIVSGDIAYVIGRKGTGKTALVQRISASDDGAGENIVSKLTFKNFPFNELYTQKNDNYTRPNQYITVWKLIIYSAACKAIARSRRVDPLIRKTIEKALPAAESDNLGTIVGKWIAGDFGFNVLGNGVNIANWLRNKKTYTIQEKVENLEAFVIKNITNQSIFILFDELDEDYKEIFGSYDKSNYIDLLTSLFKAVQDVRATVTVSGAKLFPVVFLRDDIYDLIKDADKNKWRDLQVHLEWNDEGIRKLLTHRLARVFDVDVTDFDAAWYSIFSLLPMTYSGGKKEIYSYRYISMSTQGRPRDYINYLRECADAEIRKGGIEISVESIKEADKAYSNYLKRELIDEIHGIIPDIEKVLSIFSETRKWISSVSEFRSAYLERVEVGSVSIKDADFILRTLFYFSVIGNVVRTGIHIFKHQHPDAELNFKEKILVHRGLMKSLQIL